jgi:hypothetical protein
LSRVINYNTPAKARTQLVRAIVIALRTLMSQQEVSEDTRDLAAFIALAIAEVGETVERTVGPWEKRDYWMKADRFRREWLWTEELGPAMQKAVLAEDWPEIARLAARIFEKLSHVQVPKRHRLGTPWQGSWQLLQEQNSGA